MKNNALSYRRFFAGRAKAKEFIREYVKEHGEMPTDEAIEAAKVLTKEEEAEITLNVEIGQKVAAEAGESPAEWEYIVDENSWNESYNDGVLKVYYEWADEKGAYPYKEDLWNQKEQRAANWNDIVKENGVPVEFEDGYHYVDGDGNPCVRCWLGALNAPGAKYPWCAVAVPNPFSGTIRFNYDGGEGVYPWGEGYRSFTRGFGIASIPDELGMEYILDQEGKTSFDPSKLVVTLEK